MSPADNTASTAIERARLAYEQMKRRQYNAVALQRARDRSRNIKLASPQTVQEITGYTIGSIPPFHWQPAQFRTFMDAALLHENILGVGTGTWGQEILIAPAHVVQASDAIVVNLTDATRPVMRT